MEIRLPGKKIQGRRWIGLCVAGVILLSILLLLRPSQPSVERELLTQVEVHRGDMDLMAPVFGAYASRFERLLSAPAGASVSEIYVRAGSDVEPDTLIAKLSSPELAQSLDEAKAQLGRMQSELTSLKLSQQNTQLEFEGRLADIKSDIQRATMDVEVNERLTKLGVIGTIKLDRARLLKAQLEKRLAFAGTRFAKLKETHTLEIEQKRIVLEQQSKRLARLERKQAQLNVRAGIQGTLQRLDIELGQRVEAGQALAKIGSKEQMIARIKIPKRLADRVKTGARLEVDHKTGTLMAKISQLSSVMMQGFVEAEAVFDAPLPGSLRPSEPLNGRLFVEHKENTLYVRQTAGLRPQSTQTLYLDRGDTLEQTDIRFLELSGQWLLVDSGVNAGDKLVTTDLSRWNSYSKLAVNN